MEMITDNISVADVCVLIMFIGLFIIGVALFI